MHQLTGAAADALLKTLEEPPPHVVFILATTDPEALKPTILSRCQRFDFRRVAVDDMVSRLRAISESEGIDIPDEALRLIAREATGSLRDGVNLLDQVWVMCGSTVTLEAAQEALGLSPDARAMELASAALRGKLSEGLAVLSAVQEDAIDFGRFKRQVVTHLRHALLTLTGATGTLSLSAPEMERLQEVCQGVEAPERPSRRSRRSRRRMCGAIHTSRCRWNWPWPRSCTVRRPPSSRPLPSSSARSGNSVNNGPTDSADRVNAESSNRPAIYLACRARVSGSRKWPSRRRSLSSRRQNNGQRSRPEPRPAAERNPATCSSRFGPRSGVATRD